VCPLGEYRRVCVLKAAPYWELVRHQESGLVWKGRTAAKPWTTLPVLHAPLRGYAIDSDNRVDGFAVSDTAHMGSLFRYSRPFHEQLQSGYKCSQGLLVHGSQHYAALASLRCVVL
jgi:hypothetical protein